MIQLMLFALSRCEIFHFAIFVLLAYSIIIHNQADVTEPSNDDPNRGILSVNVEISPVCKIGLNEDSSLIDTDLVSDSIEK